MKLLGQGYQNSKVRASQTDRQTDRQKTLPRHILGGNKTDGSSFTCAIHNPAGSMLQSFYVICVSAMPCASRLSRDSSCLTIPYTSYYTSHRLCYVRCLIRWFFPPRVDHPVTQLTDTPDMKRSRWRNGVDRPLMCASGNCSKHICLIACKLSLIILLI